MDEKKHVPFSRNRLHGRFLSLLILILGLIIIEPLVWNFVEIRMITDVFITAIFIFAAYTISGKRHHVLIAVLLLLPAVISVWSAYFVKIPPLQIAGNLCGVAYFGYAVVVVLIFIFQQREVTTDLLAGAAVAYLMMALMWTFLYQGLEMIQPGSFTISETAFTASWLTFLYYSFVTITTLGFGDITPTTGLASALSILEAVVGQFFLVVGVAWLVGLHVSQTLARSMDNKNE